MRRNRSVQLQPWQRRPSSRQLPTEPAKGSGNRSAFKPLHVPYGREFPPRTTSYALCHRHSLAHNHQALAGSMGASTTQAKQPVE